MRRALAALALVAVSARGDQASDRTILAYLNKAMAWYRQQQTHVALASHPGALLAVEQERRIGREVMALAFEFARAFVALQPQQPAPSQAGAGGVPSAQGLTRLSSEAEAHVRQVQAEIADLKRRIARASPRRRGALKQRLAETQSELQLSQARRETIKTMAQFIGEVGHGKATGGLLGQIEELERSVPEAKAADGSKPPAVAIGLTPDLRTSVDKLQAPLVAEMQATLQKGQEAAKAADVSAGAALQQRTRDIDQLTSRFKKLSAAVVPLGKQAVLLDADRVNLEEWHGTIDGEYATELRTLLLHLGLLAVAILAILAAS